MANGNGTSENMLAAYRRGLEKMANEIAEELAAEAAAKFQVQIKERLITGVAAILESSMSAGRMREELVITLHLKDRKDG